MTAKEWLERKAAGDAVPALHFKEFAFKLLKVGLQCLLLIPSRLLYIQF